MSFLSSFYPQPVVAGTTEGTFAEGNHTHELDELDASGISSGKVLTANGLDAASWEDPIVSSLEWSAITNKPVFGNGAGQFAEGNDARIIDITHAGLLAAMGAQTLKRGFYYRITDFVTEYMSNDNEWVSPSNTANVSNNSGTAFTVASIAATPEPLVVYAHTSSNVAREAYSESYPQDIIHYDPELTYLDGTRTAKGFITYRKEIARNIEMTFDWRNVKFKFWDFDPAAGLNPITAFQQGNSYLIGDVIVDQDNNILQCITNTTSAPSGDYALSKDAVGDWRPIWSVANMPIFDTGIFRGLGPYTDVLKSGHWGGRGRAYYLPTLSQNLSSTSSDTSGNFRNISISGSLPSAIASTRFSSRLPTVVLVRGTNGTISEVTITDSFGIFLRAARGNFSLTLSDININNSSFIFFHVVNTGNRGKINIDECSYFILPSTNNVNSLRVGSNTFKNINNSIFYSILSNVEAISCSNCCSLLQTLSGKYIDNSNCGFSFFGNYINVLCNTKPLINRKTFFGFKNNERIQVEHTMDAAKLPVCKFVNWSNKIQISPYYRPQNVLTKHANDQIIQKCKTVTDVEQAIPLFSVLDNTNSSYVRNTSSWLLENGGDVVEKISGCSVWNSVHESERVGVAITPRHVLFAKHFPLSSGCTIRFVDNSNQVVNRTVSRILLHSSASEDSGVALLDQDLPSSIKILPIFSRFDILKVQEFDTWNSNGFWINKDRKASIVAINGESLGSFFSQVPFSSNDSENFIDGYIQERDENTKEFYEPIFSGESGSPLFWIINGNPVLIGLAFQAPETPSTNGGNLHGVWRGSPVADPTLNSMIASIDSAEGISTGYTVTNPDLSSFVDIY